MTRRILCTLAILALAAACALWLTRTRPTDTPIAEPNAPQPAAQPASTATAPVAETQRSPRPVAAVAVSGKREPFADWSARYATASPQERAALVAEGVRLATARRPVFKQLIQDDPRRALAEAVPMVVRQQLPAEILALIEERVNGVGALRVYQGVPLEGEIAQSLTQRVAEMRDGKTYRAHVFGRRAESVAWTPGASLNGVALDAEMALSEDPYRVLEVGEVPASAKSIASICPVSGKNAVAPEQASAPVAETTPAIETATETLFFCDGSHITLYGGTLLMAEGGSGGAFGFTGILPAVPTPSIGVVRVLFIPVTYADQNSIPCTEAKAYELLRDVSDFYAKSSYGKLTLVPTVTPPIKLPHTEAWYIQRDTSNGGDIDGEGMSHNHARTEARRMGFDDANYDCVVMRHEGGPGSYGGLGGGSSVWLRGDSVATLAHEIGHCFALAHANFWDTAGTSAIGAGTNAEYGDSYDNMGSGGFPAAHYNAQAKFQVKWLPANFVQSVSQSGLYRIHAFDQTSLDPSRRYALTVVKDAQRTYWGEVRSLFTTNPWAERGMLLGWRFPGAGGNNLQLIDTTPGTPAGKDDAPISLGSTFSDYEAGIHITTVNVNASPRFVDVVVNVGSFPGNRRPTLSLAASAEVVPVGATVTFTATASDPDGDALAYGWQHFGDTSYRVVEPSAAVVTRTFTTAGTYVVTCTASDMKGGTATRSQLITVGSGNNRFTIRGRITLLGQGLPDVIVRANGANGVLTDSDGHYTIPNLAAGTYTMSPLLYGYTFGELFENAVTVGPNFSGADFQAAADSVVTIAASVPAANELAPVTPGRFTITRTGDTSGPLTVNVNAAQGSATRTTDYTFAPDYVAGSQGFSTFTIPADAATLDIVVTPVVDATAEGPEVVTLQLCPGPGYVLATQAAATVTIADDDTALPKVSVSSVPSVPENGGPAIVTFRTAAPVAANLTIFYSVGGIATNGTDVTNLSGTATIPDGASSVVVNVAPIDDATSESLETVRIATTANAAYLISPQAANTTLTIVDDDVQTVNVAASDPSAAEVDLTVGGAAADTGTFLITRSGDLTQPLTVYYSVSGTIGSGNAALHGVDYEALPGVLIIPANRPSAAVTILPRFDGIGEGNENVMLQLGAGPTNYILGASANATVTIADAAGDKPVVEIIPLTSATEGGASGTFRMSVRGAGTGTLAVAFSLGGSATVTTDYSVTTNATLTFDPGTLTGVATFTLNNGAAVTKDVAIVPVNDSDTEPLETVTMTVTPDAAYRTFAPTATASMWLRDSDQPTVFVDVQVGTSPATIDTFTEGATTTPVKFYLSRTGATTAALTVNYTAGGTATNGTDYTALSGVATIPAGALGVDVPVVVTNDTLAEGAETLVLTLAAGSYSAGASATMVIADNETPTPTVAFSANGSRALESAGAVTVPVTLNAAAAAPIAVEYIVDTGTRAATTASLAASLPYWVRVERSGTNFRAWRSPDNVTWTQLGATQTLDLPAEVLAGLAVSSRSDGALSTAVFDNVTFSTAPGAPLAGRTVGFVTEQGSDSIAGGVYTVIGSGAGLNASSQDECHFLAAPVTGDFTLTARVVSQTGGAATQEAGVMIRENASYRARMIHCGAQGTSGLEMLARTSTFTNAFGQAIDHTLASGTLNFTIGEQVKHIAFNVIDDTINEPNENLAILLRNPNGAQLGTLPQHTFTIEDDDLPPAVPFVGFGAAASSVAEAAGAAQVFVALTAPATAPASVDFAVTGGTAASPADYTLASGTLHFAVGESVKAIDVTLADDALIEDAETVTIALSNPSGSVPGSITSHTLTIDDGDRPVVTIAATDATATEAGDTGAFTVTRTGSTAGNLIVHFTVAGTATSGSDFAAVGTSMVIPDTQASATLTVTPQQDSTNEGGETVIVTLASDAAYTMGTPGAATVTLLDDDRSTVSIVASDPTASETAGNAGEFTVTRTAPTTGALTVTLTRTGTATNSSDYTSISTSLAFTAGQSTRTIAVTPVDDALTEGPEVVTLQIAAGSYDIGGQGYDDVTIADNDSPPALYIANPNAQGALIAAGNGVLITALVTDDGAPSPVTVQWTQVDGPGVATFDAPTSATTGAIFSTGGVYVLRVTATDGQFTVSDRISVNVGAALPAAAWISQDLNPASARRGQSGRVGGVFTVSGTGAGYGGTSDGAHVMTRQIAGDSSIVARVTALTGTGTPLTGVTIRDTLWQGARRAVLGCEPGGVVRFRTRTTASVADTSSTATAALPVWLRLVRDATTDEIAASYAPDAGGAPGAWTQLGASTAIPMDAAASLGLTTTSSTTSAIATGVLDGVTLTPAPSGPALLADDEAATASATPGSASYNAGTATYTVAGAPGAGYFYGWPYHGDLMITARHSSATSSAGSARSGIVIRESSQSGGNAMMGRIPTGSYSGFSWTSLAGGSGGGVPTFTGAVRWIRMIRRGNLITAFHAPDVSGAPGTWTQVGQPQTVIMTPNVLVGFSVNNNSGVGLNTVTFRNLSIVPLNAAPIVDAGLASGASPLSGLTLDGTVTDDGLPLSPGAFTTQWSKLNGPGTATFANPAAVDTTVAFSPSGIYVLRLTTDDGQVRSFENLTNAPPTYTVTLATPDATAAEYGLDPGGFSVTRTGGDNSDALTVYYSAGGTATAGADYTSPGGSVTIPIGQSSAAIPVNVLPDALAEPSETVTLTLNADPNYALGATVAGTVTILDDDTAPVVTITSPTVAAASIPANVGLILEATVTDDGQPLPLATTWSMVSGPGAVTFGNTAAINTTARFSTTGSYVLRLSAFDGVGTSTDDVTITVGATSSAVFTNLDIAAPRAGSGSASGGVFTVAGAGSDIYGSSDQFHFYYQTITGDFDVRARLASKTVSATGAHTALMARASTAANSIHVATSQEGSGSTYLMQRATTGGTTTIGIGGTITNTPPTWLRLQRVGANFTGYVSDDGVTWTARGPVASTLPASVLVGFAVSNSESTAAPALNTAVFDNVTGFAAANVGPFVNAGADLAVTTPAAASLDATVTDDALPAPPAAVTTTWSKASGPGVVTFGNAAAIDTTASFSTSGAYVLRLVASDGQVKTFDDLTATVTGPFEQWQQTHFGANAGNPLIAGPNADPDRDGRDNLLEYATATDPNAPSNTGIVYDVETIGPNRYLRVTITKNPAATDVTWAVQCTSTLPVSASWSSTGVVTEQNTSSVLQVRDHIPLGPTPRFIRVMVTR